MTGEEFTARAVAIYKVAHEQLRADPDAFGAKLRFSWDSASAHNSAEPDIDILPEQLVKPPVRSPDFQRPVEDTFSIVKREFNKRFASDPRVDTVKKAVKLLNRVVDEKVTPGLIKKLVGGLPATYRDVVAKGGQLAGQGRR